MWSPWSWLSTPRSAYGTRYGTASAPRGGRSAYGTGYGRASYAARGGARAAANEAGWRSLAATAAYGEPPRLRMLTAATAAERRYDQEVAPFGRAPRRLRELEAEKAEEKAWLRTGSRAAARNAYNNSMDHTVNQVNRPRSRSRGGLRLDEVIAMEARALSRSRSRQRLSARELAAAELAAGSRSRSRSRRLPLDDFVALERAANRSRSRRSSRR